MPPQPAAEGWDSLEQLSNASTATGDVVAARRCCSGTWGSFTVLFPGGVTACGGGCTLTCAGLALGGLWELLFFFTLGLWVIEPSGKAVSYAARKCLCGPAKP